MSPEKMRITIAEFCGWKFCDRVTDKKSGVSWDVYQKDGKRASTYTETIPDYLSDLNAMHEAEKLLTKEQIWKYISKLVDLTGAESLEEYAEAFVMIHATAARRAEALLRTIGKWEDS